MSLQESRSFYSLINNPRLRAINAQWSQFIVLNYREVNFCICESNSLEKGLGCHESIWPEASHQFPSFSVEENGYSEWSRTQEPTPAAKEMRKTNVIFRLDGSRARLNTTIKKCQSP